MKRGEDTAARSCGNPSCIEHGVDHHRAFAPDAKGDGETWEAYAHRLEARIKEQRDQLVSLQALRGHPANRADRVRIANLERSLGQKSLALDKQNDGLKALKKRVAELVDKQNGRVA